MALLVNIPPAGGSGALGPQGIQQARALSFLGLSATDPLVFDFFEDFKGSPGATTAPPGWLSSMAGGGSLSMTAAARGGGWARLSTNAGAGATAEIDTIGTDLPAIATNKWYFAARLAINTVPDANSILFATILNIATNKTIGFGFKTSLNATNFVVQYDGIWTGSGIDTGVARDAAVHIFEAYGTGSTTLRARIDGGSELTAVMASAPADPIRGFNVLLQNGATAANQSMEIDWMYMAGQRT